MPARSGECVSLAAWRWRRSLAFALANLVEDRLGGVLGGTGRGLGLGGLFLVVLFRRFGLDFFARAGEGGHFHDRRAAGNGVLIGLGIAHSHAAGLVIEGE